jgi:hypothetical protein
MVRLKGIVLLAACLVAGAACAQDLSHYVTPYGFRLPQLEQGEYVLSASGNYYGGDYKSIAQDPADYGWDSEYREYFASFSATCALTDRLLVQGGLSLSPSHRSQRVKHWFRYSFDSDTVVQETIESELQANVRPNLTIVFRPQPTLEIFATGQLTKQNTDVTYSHPTDPWDDKRQEQTSTYLYFGITYLGKL